MQPSPDCASLWLSGDKLDRDAIVARKGRYDWQANTTLNSRATGDLQTCQSWTTEDTVRPYGVQGTGRHPGATANNRSTNDASFVTIYVKEARYRYQKHDSLSRGTTQTRQPTSTAETALPGAVESCV